MCGIAGDLRFKDSIVDKRALTMAVRRLGERGPDGSGLLHFDWGAFGHTRLSIIDLTDDGAQPMDLPSIGVKITYNGEIYNYRELRNELQIEGFKFNTQSDTEVLAVAYRHWGLDFLEKLNGMFAFAIFDEIKNQTILARDRLGIKPLYYSANRERLVFASNIRALLSFPGIDTGIDPTALHNYMSLHAIVPEPKTILNGVNKVPAAHFGVVDSSGNLKFQKYWSPDYDRRGNSKYFQSTEEDWDELILGELRNSVKRRLVADVPVGLFLSGGVDSSLLAALIHENAPSSLQTFSVGFQGAGNEDGDEFQYSDIVAQKYSTEHTKIEVTSRDILDNLSSCLGAMNEPMVSYDNIGFYLLSKKASESVKVVQSGQGADEVFAGYHWYSRMLESKNHLEDYADEFFDRTHEEMGKVLQNKWFSRDFTREFVSSNFEEVDQVDALKKALRIDTHTMLVEDPVKRVDSNTMKWGLEARVPFLDHKLVEIAAQIPPHTLIKGGELKSILKRIASRFVPKEILYRPKGYFPVPELKAIQGNFKDYVLSYVDSDRFRNRRLFKEEYVGRISKNPENHITKLRGNELWQVASLEIWLSELGV